MTWLRQAGDTVAWLWNHTVGWLLMWALIAPIRAYQHTISRALPPTCRFHPSCSAYAVTAIRRHGALKGFALACWRLMRCNPWNHGGLDPVPDRGRWLPDVLPNGEPRHGTMKVPGSADSNI